MLACDVARVQRAQLHLIRGRIETGFRRRLANNWVPFRQCSFGSHCPGCGSAAPKRRQAAVTGNEWREVIADAAARRPAPVRAVTYLDQWPTYSRPVLLGCDNGRDYVVKGCQCGRVIVTDHVVGQLGLTLGAPVGVVVTVDVPMELIVLQPEMQHMTAGPGHGSGFLEHVSGREGIMHVDVPDNRSRFVRLAALYGWVIADDHQFIYENGPPPLVHSVDHGHFFSGGINWTEATLTSAPGPDLDSILCASCSFTSAERAEACDALQSIEDVQIAEVVAGPPDSWPVTDDERIALAQYLSVRRDDLVAKLRS